MSNFFNSIGMADMEKVHSAVIGWILSDKCTAFGIDKKSGILCSLFKISPAVLFDKIDVKIEIYNIDILITTERNGTKECWVIENKIKSNQHSNQLDKYVMIINSTALTKGSKSKPITDKYKDIKDSNQHYCFLTLIDEPPIGKYCAKWVNTKYSDLSGILCKYKSVSTGDDGVIFTQYVECISSLSNWLSDFCSNPQDYPHVFTDGSKKKTDKDYSDIKLDKGEHALDIAECGLETIFQKCYLGNLANNIQHPFVISDTHGNAMLNLDVTDAIEWGMVNKKYQGVNLHAGIELQNGTFKIQIHDMYNKVGSDAAKRTFNSQWEEAFQEAFPSKTINPSKKNGRYYVSMSILSQPDWWKGSSCMDLNEIIETCINELQKVVDSHP